MIILPERQFFYLTDHLFVLTFLQLYCVSTARLPLIFWQLTCRFLQKIIYQNLSINFHELLEVFDNNSSTKLSNSSIKIFKKDIEFVKKDIENELEKIRIKEYKSYNDFIKDITKVIVISFKTPILYQFITFYGETIIPYLLYFFNNKKLKNEARTLKKLKEIYMKQTERLIKDYIFCIERIT